MYTNWSRKLNTASEARALLRPSPLISGFNPKIYI